MLAQLTSTDNWSVVIALGILLSLGLSSISFIRQVAGKGGERQIEPTQIAAIQAELKTQTGTLNHINREVGEVKTSVESLTDQMDGMHARVGGISRELAGTTSRVDGLERREGPRHA